MRINSLILAVVCNLILILIEGQQFIQRPLSSTSTMFELFSRSISFTGNPYNDVITVLTNFGSNLNGNRFIDLALGLEDIQHSSNLAGFFFDFNLQVAQTFIKVNFLTSRCYNCGSVKNIYTFRGIFFCIDKEAPFYKHRFTGSLKLQTYMSSFIVKDYTLSYPLTSQLTTNCYADSQKSIKEQIILIPFLMVLEHSNLMYFNFSSPSPNMRFNWNSSTANLQVNFMAYLESYSSLYSFTVDILGLCPNSYYFTNRNVVFKYLYQSQHVNTPAPSLPPNKPSYSLSLTITGVNFDPDYYYTQMHQLQMIQMNYYISQTNNYATLAIGIGLSCPISYSLFNLTHCFCNSSLNLHYSPTISNNYCTLICPTSTYQASATVCRNCSQTFGSSCLTCNFTTCLSCSQDKLLMNSIPGCVKCSQLSVGCLDCTLSACILCNINFILVNEKCTCTIDRFLNINATCILCQNTFPLCQYCTNSSCTACINNSSMQNGSCQCIASYVRQNASCVQCSSLFGLACISCNISRCTACNSSYILLNETCQNCSIYNTFCSSCNQSACLACRNGFILDQNSSCTCLSPLRAVQNDTCYLCSEIQTNCASCNSSQCFKCLKNYTSLGWKCLCSGDRFLINNQCVLCVTVFENCLNCTASGCNSCANNRTLVGQKCRCEAPRTEVYIDSNAFCLTCNDIDPSSCNLNISIQSWQIGNTLYFSLHFNHPLNQIDFLIPLKYNVIARVSKSVSFTEQNNIYSLQIKPDFSQYLQISIAKKQLIRWRNSYLQNDLPPIRVYYTQSFVIQSEVIEWFLNIASKFLYFGLILNLGYFSRTFQETNILSFLLFIYSFNGNELGVLLHSINLHKIYQLVSNNLLMISNSKLIVSDSRFALYDLNTSFIQQNIQFFIALMVSTLIYLYIRGYLKTKRNAKKHFAFNNFIEFGGEYSMTNVISGLSLLSLPALLQIKIYSELEWSMSQPIDFLNLISAGLVLLTPFVLFGLSWLIYPPKVRRYAVIYSELRSENKRALVSHIFSFIRPYLLAVSLIWIDIDITRIIFLTANSLNIAIILVNASCFNSKMTFILRLLKCLLALFVNFSIHFSSSQQAMLTIVAAYCVLSVISIEILEIGAKTIVLILTNKQLIIFVQKDQQSIQILQQIDSINQKAQSKEVPQLITAEPFQTQKAQLMEMLHSAKEELQQLLQRRRQRKPR